MKTYAIPFLTGFLQVFLVTITTVLVAGGHQNAATVSSFLISLVWTFNVRAALGSWLVRITYCLGAATGTNLGFIAGHVIAALTQTPQ